MNTTIESRGALKDAIKSIATEITVGRAFARTKVAEARRLRAAGDAAGAEAASAAAVRARRDVEPLSREVRLLLLAYAFLRGRSYQSLERTRRRAPAPSAREVIAHLPPPAPPTETVRRWLEEPSIEAPPAPRAVTPAPVIELDGVGGGAGPGALALEPTGT